MAYQTLAVALKDGICTVRLNRPSAGNAIDARLVEEFGEVLRSCAEEDQPSPVTILVLEGSAEVFCTGGDFEAAAADAPVDPGPLYDLWLRMATGPFVSVSVVRGRANAGGIGFVAASDIVLADRTASFGLSELLFGLFPACVLPFLVRRIGVQKAHYLALTTRAVAAEEAAQWGLVDALDDQVEGLLRKHLLRLRHLGKPAIGRYKRYMAELAGDLERHRPAALAANRALFGDPEIRRNIRRYVDERKFPWES
jgi:polyketide biosynthesis enoyl-CoA hydratase PksH